MRQDYFFSFSVRFISFVISITTNLPVIKTAYRLLKIIFFLGRKGIKVSRSLRVSTLLYSKASKKKSYVILVNKVISKFFQKFILII